MNKIRIPEEFSCLVIEDSEMRHKWFRSKLPDCTIATSPDEGVSILKTVGDKFDIVFLDHDAVVEFVEPTDDGFLDRSFWCVAQQLYRMEFKGQIIIHSGNPVGAQRMAFLLKSKCKVEVMPFGSFDIEVF
jgi:hypothetical protein